jgi:dipeptidyl aminopeptidase/acylaminoacyl peptidase
MIVVIVATLLLTRSLADDPFLTPPKTEEVEFTNGEVKLSGTLWKPEGKGPFPAVVWCHGSGKTSREGGLAYMPGFLRAGYVFLAWDKPGVGKSGSGTYVQQPLGVRAQEVLAAVEMLKKRDDIDPKRIGFAGISQAGYVLPKAAHQWAPAFCVLLSPGAWRLEDEYAYQDKTHLVEQMLLGAGMRDEKQRVEAAGYFRKLRDAGFREEYERARTLCKEVRSKPWFPTIEPLGLFFDPEDKTIAEQLKKGLKGFRDFAPITEYSWLTCPTLVLFGAKDMCIDPTACEKNIRAGFEKSGNKKLTVITYPEEGHGISGEKASETIEKWLAGRAKGGHRAQQEAAGPNVARLCTCQTQLKW